MVVEIDEEEWGVAGGVDGMGGNEKTCFRTEGPSRMEGRFKDSENVGPMFRERHSLALVLGRTESCERGRGGE